MPQKIVFQDNIFQITRSLDVLKNGLQLELSAELFTKKIINDMLFFDFALQNIFNQLEQQSQLPSYLDTMHNLYFCITKYINILQYILSDRQAALLQNNHSEKFQIICKKYQEIISKISVDIQDNEITQDSINIVSQNELSELLNFG